MTSIRSFFQQSPSSESVSARTKSPKLRQPPGVGAEPARKKVRTAPNAGEAPKGVIDLCGSGSESEKDQKSTSTREQRPRKPQAPRRSSSNCIVLDGASSSGEDEDDKDLVGKQQPQTDEQTCPVCSKDLGKLKPPRATEHVNKCLDGIQCPSTASKPLSKHAKPVHDNSSDPQPAQADASQAKAGPTAFTALMASNAEQKQWKAAEQAAKSRKVSTQIAARQRAKLTGRQDKFKIHVDRSAPFYKILDGMPIAVDAFCYGAVPNVKAYFLSHAHADHYTQLSGNWCHGPIYCSRTTANLIVLKLGVDKKWVKPLDFDQPFELPNVPGPVKVTMMDANHCPGSSIFLFEGPQTLPNAPFRNSKRIFRYLHCGDFRASPAHLEHPAMQRKKMDIIYLDTTYCDPKYQFPAQEQVISACAELIRGFVREGDLDALKKGFKDGAQTLKSEHMIKSWLGNRPVKEETKKDEGADDLKESATAKAQVKEEATEPDDPHKQRECSQPVEPAPAPGEDDSEWPPPPDEGEEEEDILGDRADELDFEDEDSKEPVVSKVEHELWADEKKPVGERILVLVGTYSVGKERLVKAIAKALDSQIFGSENKLELIRCIDEDPELRGMTTTNPLAASVHISRLDAINRENMTEYLDSFKGHFTKIIGLRPTGWTYRSDSGANKVPAVAQVIANQTHKNYSPAWLYPQRDSTDRVQGYGVPYSEHSSFRELTCFCTSIDHVRIIPTVNVHSEASRSKMRGWFERWQAERKRRRDIGDPAMVPYRTIDYW